MVTLYFVLSTLLILLTPGPTNTVLATCGASLGIRHAAIMPFAEAIGYFLAVSFFVVLADRVQGNASAFVATKLLAAGWLLYSAVKLWGMPLRTDAKSARQLFVRVLLTTIVNPKAMLVGAVLIPSEADVAVSIWVATYAAMSTLVGFGWVVFGACLPFGVRRHSYKLASLVLGGFSMAAMASALSG
ncbi:threonine/homoserine/homoserine lactone efflux protein [Sinorhizobium fredii]|uniref:Putative threonine efflux protein-like protein n=1 Tax=Sinorhizobium fredii (strain USDA 257) TaxID=1185652 RepID=I3X975_SINF2|nr:threonine transporter [Sinorhizobium fredii]AFL52431.1 putative threonine efflux protein-like protein [Sinorhizobium fredii USDA 257]